MTQDAQFHSACLPAAWFNENEGHDQARLRLEVEHPHPHGAHPPVRHLP